MGVGRDDTADAYRALSPAQRAFSVGRPHVFYWVAAIETVLFVAFGIVLLLRSVAAGIAVMAIGVFAALLTAWPAHWSEKHPDEAHRAVQVQRARRDRLAQRHPAYFVVIVPIITAISAATRWNSHHRHPSTLDWVIPAACGLAFGLVVGLILIRRAHRSQRPQR